jgi:rare lipoprotein A
MWKALAAAAVFLVSASCSTQAPGPAQVATTAAKIWGPLAMHGGAPQKILSGIASWYGPRFHGRQTANGEKYNMNALTAAHKSLPFGTLVRVTNLANRVQTVVRINDRGPYVGDRLIDLSKAAARAVGMLDSGVSQVKLEVLG